MQKTPAALLIILLIATVVSIYTINPPQSNSGVIVVPDDFSTIQEAINSASDGDTVFVKEGIYPVVGLRINKSISLIGEDSCRSILDGKSETLYLFPSGHKAISIRAPNVLISGFNITNCDDGIYIGDLGAHIEGNNINHNMAGLTGGTTNGVISNNNFTHNVKGCSLTCKNSLFLNNLFSDNRGSLGLGSSHNVTICYNRIIDNSNGLGLASNSNISIFRNSFTRNLDASSSLGINLPVQGYGISFASNNNKTLIYENNIGGNSKGIIITYRSALTSMDSDNAVYRNNFYDNGLNADATLNETGVVSWSCEGVGNYWDDYSGSGNYAIAQGNVDYYPLIEKVAVEIPMVSVSAIAPSGFDLSFLVGVVSGAVAVVAAAGLLMFFKKHRHSN